MSVSSTLWASIDAIVATFESAGLPVDDGPILNGAFEDAVYVGYDGDPEGEQIAADMQQNWAGSVGAKRRDEVLDVHGCVIATYGDGDTWKSARDRAKGYLVALESALRADPSLGQPPPFVAEFRPRLAYQEFTDMGFRVRVPFTVHIQTRV